MLDKMQKLEMDLGDLEERNHEYKMQLRNSHKVGSPDRFSAGGYVITTTPDVRNSERIPDTKSFLTANYGRKEQKTRDIHGEVIKSMLKTVNNLITVVQEKVEETKSQQRFLVEIDQQLEKVEQQQDIIIQDLQYQHGVIVEIHDDFDLHK